MKATNLHGKLAALGLALAGVVAFLAPSFARADDDENEREDAQILIYNIDQPGVGFNDPTPAAPVGGNTGTSVGQQRLNAFSYAAKLWSMQLESEVPITVIATFSPLPCSANGAVLGAAGPNNVFSDFPGAGKPGTWYVAALANKLAKQLLVVPTGNPIADADIFAVFNSDLGSPGCLAGSGFYLGLDNNHGPLVDLVSVLLHEFGHGLGFLTLTNIVNGSGDQFFGMPFIFDHFLYDNTQKRTWAQMTDAQRLVSATNTRGLVWRGEEVTEAAPYVLAPGVPELRTVPDISGGTEILLGTASFGPLVTARGISADVGKVTDQADGTGLACTALNATNAAAVRGRIALIDRGVCLFPVKVKNAQNAGARAVLIANNTPGSAPPGLPGTDQTITIPALMISDVVGLSLKTALRAGRVSAKLAANLARVNGTDARGRVFIYTPDPYVPGSSVSHYDVSTFPNQLMEFAISGDLEHEVSPPFDLTRPLLDDTGWGDDGDDDDDDDDNDD